MSFCNSMDKETDSADSNDFLKKLVKPHLDSFNEFLDHGLSRSTKKIHPIEFKMGSSLIKICYEEADISVPYVGDNISSLIYPRECRVRGITYAGKLVVRIGWYINGDYQGSLSKVLGNVPVMVKSERCAIRSLDPNALVLQGEEPNEQGGYFICSGIERVLRMLVTQRRNYPLAISRPSWKSKASGLTEIGISLRCVDSCNNMVTNILHYANDTSMHLSISYRKQQYYIPFLIVIKLLVDFSDYQIYSDLIRYNQSCSIWTESIKCMLSTLHEMKILHMEDAKNHVGRAFRVKLGLPDFYSDSDVAHFLIKNTICIHLKENVNKYNLLIFMVHKLMAFVDNKIREETVDTISNQEVLLSGQIYQVVLRDKMSSWLNTLRHRIIAIVGVSSKKENFTLSVAQINTAMGRCPDVGQQMEYFIRSGNIVSRNGLGLPQLNGYSIVADKLNFIRFISHFRSIHRGAYFTRAYSINPRKLLPECWGFLCPVHTPDGEPCGLLNHLTHACELVCTKQDIRPYLEIIYASKIVPYPPNVDTSDNILVMVDGRIMGYIEMQDGKELVKSLKNLKVISHDNLEIVMIERAEFMFSFPGIFLFSNPSRLIRPVINLEFNLKEYIGTLEQVFLLIAVTKDDIQKNTTHVEIDPLSILSVTAALTPFSDCNQSPRNMYQCQMMKQSMGVAITNQNFRFDNKVYRLLCVQSPICQNSIYQSVGLDNYPIGFNAVLAVISYTGYDMDDAIIINRATLERGFASGCVFKSLMIDLAEESCGSKDRVLIFGCRDTDRCFYEKHLDLDGLPPVGRLINPGEAFYSFYDPLTNEYTVKKFKLSESGYVDGVAILKSNTPGISKVNVRLRIPRNPIVGDKFSSRHGQKGILSITWEPEDMPFTEDGIIPDIIFNPHGFPSRMTIGMMIEALASKLGSLNGTYLDSSPFKSGQDSLVEYFGEKLAQLGYNYYGTERMYSGTNGMELEVNIFTGIVYYQRLRHMVSDKFQVRSSGPVDAVTRQPVGGRARGGGVRFGEMERDSMISHGCSYLLQDRLFDCSDKSLAYICSKCGDLLATKLDPGRSFNPMIKFKPPSVVENKNCKQFTCLLCNSGAHIRAIFVPYVFRYLLVELASMNIRLKLNIE